MVAGALQGRADAKAELEELQRQGVQQQQQQAGLAEEQQQQQGGGGLMLTGDQVMQWSANGDLSSRRNMTDLSRCGRAGGRERFMGPTSRFGV